MLIYKTSRPNIVAYFIKQWLISCVILFLPTLPSYIFKGHALKGYYWIVVPGLIVIIIEQLNTRRLAELKIDADNGLIYFESKTIFSKKEVTTLAIKSTRLEIAKSKTNFLKILEPVTLYFLKGKEEIFKLNKSKDGFAVETLMQIAAAIENLKMPITEV